MATGAIQYALGGAGYDTPIGLVTGGRWGEDTQSQTLESIGGVGTIVAGPALTRATLSVIPVNANALLDKILRVEYPQGGPPAFPLEVGDDELGIKHALWMINTAELAMEAPNGALTADYEIMCFTKHERAAGGGDHSAVPKTAMLWYRGYVQVGGVDFDARSCRMRINNNLIPRYTLDEGAAGTLRYPDAYDVGAEQPDISVEYFADPDHDLSGDEITTATLVMLARNAGAANTVTFTATNAKILDWESGPVMPNDQKVYSVNYAMDWNSGAFTIALS